MDLLNALQLSKRFDKCQPISIINRGSFEPACPWARFFRQEFAMLSSRWKEGSAVLVAACLVAGGAMGEVGVTDTTIKIGMFGPLTGSFSVYGYPINNGAIALYNDINERGGINGRKIEIIQEDGSCD